MKKKLALVILDGWGYGAKDDADAIFNAQTPTMDALHLKHPHAALRTDGEFVGLPVGQMGNSEVGHMNIGAGRVVFQDLLRINKAIEIGEFSSESVLQDAILKAKTSSSRLHLMGLVSRGGVHSQQEHLYALIDVINSSGLTDVVIHAFTDGRDTAPRAGIEYLKELEEYLKSTGSCAEIATIHGRYFAMDRDNRWERISKSYEVLCKSGGVEFDSVNAGIMASYNVNIGDEFIIPFRVKGVDGTLCPNDVAICFNFRTDRCRQITTALTQQNFPDHEMSTLPIHFVTMTNYDDKFYEKYEIFKIIKCYKYLKDIQT